MKYVSVSGVSKYGYAHVILICFRSYKTSTYKMAVETSSSGSPLALPLVFTHDRSLYSAHVKCIFDNDSFTGTFHLTLHVIQVPTGVYVNALLRQL